MNSALILFAWNLGLLFPIALAAWCLCRVPLIRRQPAFCHGLWLVVLLKFLTPPWIPIPLLPAVANLDEHQSAAAISPSVSREFAKEVKPTADGKVLRSSDDFLLPEQPTFSSNEQSELHAEEESFLATIRRRQWVLFALFVLSGVITLVLWAAARRQLKRTKRLLRSGLDGAERCGHLLEEIASRFRVKNVPKVCLIESEVSPMLWAEPGRPVILLPRTLIEKLSREELQLVLAHELAHYLRRDHWTNLFAFLVASLFWWHPVAWLARRELIQASESGCDAFVLERFRGSRKSYAQTLLKVVDFIATRSSVQTGWASHFGGASPLGRRIELIANSTVSVSMSRSGWSLLLVVALASSLLPVRSRDELKPSEFGPTAAGPRIDTTSPTASGPFFVQGSVVEKGTRRPIAGVSLSFSVDGENDEEKRKLTTSTDAEGRFWLEVPMGVVQLWNPDLKPGYWLTYDESTVTVNTSVEQPVATLEIEARRGAVWPIQIKTDQPVLKKTSLVAILREEEDDVRRAKLLNREDTGSSLSPPSPVTSTRFDGEGKGLLTQCGTSGKFYLAVGEQDLTTVSDLRLEAIATEWIVDPSFDPSKVKTVNSIAGTDRVELVDEKGSQARIHKATVTLERGQARVIFHLKQNKAKYQDIVGMVVDSRGQPLADVEVHGNLHGESSEAELPGVVKTDRSGGYRYRLPVDSTEPAAKISLSLLFRKEGYSTGSSRAFSLSKTPGEAIDAATHTLQLGHQLSFVVVDQRGKPIAGAVVHASGDRFADWLTLRTDAAGRCFLRSLPAGLAQIHVTNGKLHAHYSVVISPIDAENTELTFRFNPPPAPEPSMKLPTPLEVGKLAPEWDLDGWSDGKKRTLADFRGKWVVLHFWSMAWNPSVRRIPFCQGVADQEQLRDVVFLAMHTPGGDPVQIQRLQKSTGWKALCAIDRGTTLFDGETAKKYGARNPGTFIINPEGKVVFNDVYKELTPSQVAERERELKELAASMNLSWPLPHRDDEASEALENRFYSTQFGREIEKMKREK